MPCVKRPHDTAKLELGALELSLLGRKTVISCQAATLVFWDPSGCSGDGDSTPHVVRKTAFCLANPARRWSPTCAVSILGTWFYLIN